jgi:hypothetical protein
MAIKGILQKNITRYSCQMALVRPRSRWRCHMRTAVQNKMGKNGHKYKRSIYVGIKMGSSMVYCIKKS